MRIDTGAREMTLAEVVDRLPPVHSARDEYMALTAEAERLRTALAKIAGGDLAVGQQAHDYKLIARTALEGE